MNRTRQNNDYRQAFLAERVRLAQQSGQPFANISAGTGEGSAHSEIPVSRFSHDPMATPSTLIEKITQD